MADFICPIINPRLTSKFGWRDIGRGKEWHQGVDLCDQVAGKKVAVYASAGGKVIRVGKLGSYGNIVMIQHNINGKRTDTNYAHLSSYSVKVGDVVKQGQQIGISGNTGGSFGVHLHFEIHNGAWVTGQKNAVDPMKYIKLNQDVSNTSKVPIKNNTTEMSDDKLKFTNETTKNMIREFLKQSVNNKYIDSSWLTRFDNGIMTSGDLSALQMIVNNKKANSK